MRPSRRVVASVRVRRQEPLRVLDGDFNGPWPILRNHCPTSSLSLEEMVTGSVIIYENNDWLKKPFLGCVTRPLCSEASHAT